jgi:hypothetical protein
MLWIVVIGQVNIGYGQMGVVHSLRVRSHGILLVATLIWQVDAFVYGTFLVLTMERVHMMELGQC